MTTRWTAATAAALAAALARNVRPDAELAEARQLAAYVFEAEERWRRRRSEAICAGALGFPGRRTRTGGDT